MFYLLLYLTKKKKCSICCSEFNDICARSLIPFTNSCFHTSFSFSFCNKSDSRNQHPISVIQNVEYLHANRMLRTRVTQSNDIEARHIKLKFEESSLVFSIVEVVINKVFQYFKCDVVVAFGESYFYCSRDANMHILSSVYVFCSFLFLPFGLFLFDIPYTFLY